MNTSYPFTVFTVALLGLTSGLSAQTSGLFDPLAVPNGTVMCRSVPANAVDSTYDVVVNLIFRDWADPETLRDIVIGYGGSGDPISLQVIASEGLRDSVYRMHLIVARFDSGGGARITVGVDSLGAPPFGGDSSGTRSLASQTEAPLTSTEMTRARQLAATLWRVDCGRRAAEPTDSRRP